MLLAACTAGAEDSDLAPPSLELTGRVVDAADILPAEYEERLSNELATLERDTQVQLVVATTPGLQGDAIETYSLNLANSWGIGNAERNDGLMILVAHKERKVRIEVGRGLEASVTNAEAARIIEDDMIPHFRTGNFEKALDAGVKQLRNEVTPAMLEKAA